jgi:hypothetical protein
MRGRHGGGWGGGPGGGGGAEQGWGPAPWNPPGRATVQRGSPPARRRRGARGPRRAGRAGRASARLPRGPQRAAASRPSSGAPALRAHSLGIQHLHAVAASPTSRSSCLRQGPRGRTPPAGGGCSRRRLHQRPGRPTGADAALPARCGCDGQAPARVSGPRVGGAPRFGGGRDAPPHLCGPRAATPRLQAAPTAPRRARARRPARAVRAARPTRPAGPVPPSAAARGVTPAAC